MKGINTYILVLFFIIPIYIGLVMRFKIENVKWTLRTFLFFISMPFLVFIVLPVLCPIYILNNAKGIKKIFLSIKIIFLIIIFNQKVFDLLLTYLEKKDDKGKIFVVKKDFKDLPQKITNDFCVAF